MQTTRFTRRHLPHWEVAEGRYFVTVRCADSLPAEAIEKLAELHRAIAPIPPRAPEFVRMQRTIFRTLERYLDAGCGACLLSKTSVAEVVVDEFRALNDCGVVVPHYSVMPNHWHALIVSDGPWKLSLSDVMKRLKGRTAKRIRRVEPGSGPFWQRERFDRWVRNDGEWARSVEYIRQNPVRAGLVQAWNEHPWTQ